MVTIDVNYGKLAGGARMGEVRIKKVLKAFERSAPSPARREVSLAFVDDCEMRRLNKAWRGKDATTDVLSFGDGKGNGEIIISYPQAVKQARELKHGVQDELVFLLVHGLLHLNSLDHEAPKDARQMFPLQEKILRSLGVDPRL